MSAFVAKKCFVENVELANAQSQPEKHNLYKGLAHLTDAIAELEGQVRQVQHDLQKLKNSLR